jgi:hypothetical protein
MRVRIGFTASPYRRRTLATCGCHRERRGEIWSVWEPTEEERELLALGGRVVLALSTEPIPPVCIWVASDEQTAPVAEHTFRVPRELEERQS